MCRGVERAGFAARALPLADGGEGTLDALLGSLPGTRLHGDGDRPGRRRRRGRVGGARGRHRRRRDGARERPRARRAQRPADGDDLRHRRADRRRDRPRLPPRHRRRRRLGDGRRRPRRARGALLVAPRRRGARRLRRDDRLPRRPGAVRPPEGRLGGRDRRCSRGACAALAERLPRHAGCRRSRASRARAPPAVSAAVSRRSAPGSSPGFDVVADAVGFPAALAASSAVITGEGRVDLSTLSGKVVARVLEAARAPDRPAAVIAGAIAPGLDLGVPARRSPRWEAATRSAMRRSSSRRPPSPSRRSSERLGDVRDDHERAGRVVGDVLADRAEQEPLRRAEPARADDEELGSRRPARASTAGGATFDRERLDRRRSARGKSQSSASRSTSSAWCSAATKASGVAAKASPT